MKVVWVVTIILSSMLALEPPMKPGKYIDLSVGGDFGEYEVEKIKTKVEKVLKEIDFETLKVKRTVNQYQCVGVDKNLCPHNMVACTATYEKPDCANGSINPYTHMCEDSVEKIVCPEGWEYDPEEDRCFHRPICPGGGIFNSTKNRCELPTEYACNKSVIAASSATAGEHYIKVDGVSYQSDGNWCIASFKEAWQLLEYRCFNTASSTNEADAMKAFIASIPAGSYVAAVTYGDPKTNVSNNDDMVAALVTLGASRNKVSGLGDRSSYVLLGIKGESIGGRIMESMDPVGGTIYATNFASGYMEQVDEDGRVVCVKDVSCGKGTYNPQKDRCEYTPNYSCADGYEFDENLSNTVTSVYCREDLGYMLSEDKSECIKTSNHFTTTDNCPQVTLLETMASGLKIDLGSDVCYYESSVPQCPDGYEVKEVDGSLKCVAIAQCSSGLLVSGPGEDLCSDGSQAGCSYGSHYSDFVQYTDYCVGDLYGSTKRCDADAGYLLSVVDGKKVCSAPIVCLDDQFASYDKERDVCYREPLTSNTVLCLAQSDPSIEDACGQPNGSRKIDLIVEEDRCLYYVDLGSMECDEANGYYPYIDEQGIGRCVKMLPSTPLASSYPKEMNPADNCPDFPNATVTVMGGDVDKCLVDAIPQCPDGYEPGAVDGNEEECQRIVTNENCPSGYEYNAMTNRCENSISACNGAVYERDKDVCIVSVTGKLTSSEYDISIQGYENGGTSKFFPIVDNSMKVHITQDVFDNIADTSLLTSHYENWGWYGPLYGYPPLFTVACYAPKNSDSGIIEVCIWEGVYIYPGMKYYYYKIPYDSCPQGTHYFEYKYGDTYLFRDCIVNIQTGCDNRQLLWEDYDYLGHDLYACQADVVPDTSTTVEQVPNCPNGDLRDGNTCYTNPSCDGSLFANVSSVQDKCYTQVTYLDPPPSWTFDSVAKKYYADIICSKNSSASYDFAWDACRYDVGDNYTCDTSLGYYPVIEDGKQACEKIPVCPNDTDTYWDTDLHACVDVASALCSGGIGLNPATGKIEPCSASQEWCMLYEYDAADDKCVVPQISCGTSIFDSEKEICYYYPDEVGCRTDLGYVLNQPDPTDPSKDECYIEDLSALQSICLNEDNFRIDTGYDETLNAHGDYNSTQISDSIVFSTLYHACVTGYDTDFNRGIVGHVCPDPYSYTFVHKRIGYISQDGNVTNNGIVNRCEMVPICHEGVFNQKNNSCYLGDLSCPIGNYPCYLRSEEKIPDPNASDGFVEDRWCSPIPCHENQCIVASCESDPPPDPVNPEICHEKDCDGYKPYTECVKKVCPAGAIEREVIVGTEESSDGLYKLMMSIPIIEKKCFKYACPNLEGVFVEGDECYIMACPPESIARDGKCIMSK